MAVLDHVEEELNDLVGGRRGTSPLHINAVMHKWEGVALRELMDKSMHPVVRLAGMEPALIKPESGFQLIKERCNLMGSAKFNKLADAYKWDEAMDVCIAQC